MSVNIEKSWKDSLNDEFDKEYFIKLIDFVKTEYNAKKGIIFPKGSQIFRAFDACPIDKVRVVILGQDPYPTKGHAHGLCFSVESNIKPLPKSLMNIYKELSQEFPGYKYENGDLNRWADQGVLLLNSVLTVQEGLPNSHAGKGWEIFTDRVISKLNDKRQNVVYLLWGSKAIQKADNVDKTANLILSAPHPSPLSAHRGFLGCNHFKLANEYLISNGYKPIEW